MTERLRPSHRCNCSPTAQSRYHHPSIDAIALTTAAAAAVVVVVFTASLLSVADAVPKRSLFEPKSSGKIPTRRCLNIGSTDAEGPYLPEAPYTVYITRNTNVSTAPADSTVSNTPYGPAYLTQRQGRKIRLRVRIDPAFNYTVVLGFAETDEAGICAGKGKRMFSARVHDRSVRFLNVFNKVGCFSKYTRTFHKIQPRNNAVIDILLSGNKGDAILSTACFTRQKEAVRPTTEPTVEPTPTPVETEPTPEPVGSSVTESACKAMGCDSLEGRIGTTVIGASFARRNPGQECRLRNVAAARLRLPPKTRIARAILYWSALAPIPSGGTSVTLNGMNVTSDVVHDLSVSRLVYYGAQADVTHLVTKPKFLQVRGIHFDAADSCIFGIEYAGWSLVVVYENKNLPPARVNVCTSPMFVYNHGSVTDGCLPRRGAATTEATTTLVAFDGELRFKEGHLLINGREMGKDLFTGSTATDLDIVRLDILPVLSDVESELRYEILQSGDFIIIPLRVTHVVL